MSRHIQQCIYAKHRFYGERGVFAKMAKRGRLLKNLGTIDYGRVIFTTKMHKKNTERAASGGIKEKVYATGET